jgi:hypothetical protein
MAEIPAATAEFVDQCVKEYELTFHQGSEKDLSAAKLRYLPYTRLPRRHTANGAMLQACLGIGSLDRVEAQLQGSERSR